MNTHCFMSRRNLIVETIVMTAAMRAQMTRERYDAWDRRFSDDGDNGDFMSSRRHEHYENIRRRDLAKYEEEIKIEKGKTEVCGSRGADEVAAGHDLFLLFYLDPYGWVCRSQGVGGHHPAVIGNHPGLEHNTLIQESIANAKSIQERNSCANSSCGVRHSSCGRFQFIQRSIWPDAPAQWVYIRCTTAY